VPGLREGGAMSGQAAWLKRVEARWAPETPAPSGEPRDENRPYTAEEFLDLPVALREQVPTKLRPEMFGGPAAAPAKEDDRG
jgi:hypothetical protein